MATYSPEKKLKFGIYSPAKNFKFGIYSFKN